MYIKSWAIYKDIIKENDYKHTQKWLEKNIHGGLESGWGIWKSKWHYEKILNAFMGAELFYVCHS